MCLSLVTTPFLYQPSVSGDPLEFLLHDLRTTKAQALQNETDTIGRSHRDCLRQPSFPQQQYLLSQETSGGWRPVIILTPLNGFCLVDKVQIGDCNISIGFHQERGLDKVYFQITIHLKSRPYLKFSISGMTYQF